MSLINLPHLFLLLIWLLGRIHIWPHPNLWSIRKPNSSIMVFQKLALHPQDFHLKQLRNIKRHFINLFQAICFFILLNEFLIISEWSIIIFDFFLWILWVHWCKELNQYWCSTTNLCSNTCLNEWYILPERLWTWSSVICEELAEAASIIHLYFAIIWKLWFNLILIFLNFKSKLSILSICIKLSIKLGINQFRIRIQKPDYSTILKGTQFPVLLDILFFFIFVFLSPILAILLTCFSCCDGIGFGQEGTTTYVQWAVESHHLFVLMFFHWSCSLLTTLPLVEHWSFHVFVVVVVEEINWLNIVMIASEIRTISSIEYTKFIFLPISYCVLEVSSDIDKLDSFLWSWSLTSETLVSVHFHYHSRIAIFEEAGVRKYQLATFDQMRLLWRREQMFH